MYEKLLKIATGRSIYSTYFLLAFMAIAPAAIFTESVFLDGIAWLMLIVLGFFIGVTGVVTFHEAWESRQWPTIDANLISCRLARRRSKNSIRYTPKIECEFYVNGKCYKGTEYDFSSSSTNMEQAERILEKVKAMRPLLVRYKPLDPTINVIVPGVHLVHYLRLITGPVMVIVAILSWAGLITYK